MNWITLNKIELQKTETGTTVRYDYDAPELLKAYIKGSPLFAEYPGDLSGIPEAVLAVPFVGIMLTVTMLLKIGIRVPVLDKAFYDSTKQIGEVFSRMYRKADLYASIQADRTEVCSYEPSGKTSLFFTGGVDATSALAEIVEQKPVLVNIWGGDLRLTDDASHVELEAYLNQLTTHIGTDYCFIKTNAREMFEENKLGYLCEKLLGHRFNHGWWASIAHILSMTTTIAPWLWKNRIACHYIGSSYDGQRSTLDANNDEMVDAIRCGSCKFTMVDSTTDRNDKIAKIIRYTAITKSRIQLKVCWRRHAGQNCSSCEKCYRTIMSIIANHGDPNDFGFCVRTSTLDEIRCFLKENTVNLGFWNTIQQSFQANRDYWNSIPEISWILKVRINSPAVYLRKLKRKLFH